MNTQLSIPPSDCGHIARRYHFRGRNGFHQMPQTSYSEKLCDPRWQKKRLEILDRDNFTCRMCFEKLEQLQVHHKFYRSGAAPWEYEDDELMTLCRTCHNAVWELHKEIGLLLLDTSSHRLLRDLAMFLNESDSLEQSMLSVIMNVVRRWRPNLEPFYDLAVQELHNQRGI